MGDSCLTIFKILKEFSLITPVFRCVSFLFRVIYIDAALMHHLHVVLCCTVLGLVVKRNPTNGTTKLESPEWTILKTADLNNDTYSYRTSQVLCSRNAKKEVSHTFSLFLCVTTFECTPYSCCQSACCEVMEHKTGIYLITISVHDPTLQCSSFILNCISV